MLFDFQTGQSIEKMPHEETYNRWMENLNERQFENIIDEIHFFMEEKKSFVSSHVPGHDWKSPYIDIYHACNQDYDASRLFFGQLCWRAVQLHSENWAFTSEPDRADGQPGGKRYFRYHG